MQNRHRQRGSLKGTVYGLFAATVFTLLGCSSSEYKIAPVEGVVTYQGSKLTFGKLYFRPVKSGGEGENPGRPAFGTIDEHGHYRLSTYGQYDGAIVGAHNVQFIMPSGDENKKAFFAQGKEKPPKFLRPKESRVEVKSGSNVLDIELVEKN